LSSAKADDVKIAQRFSAGIRNATKVAVRETDDRGLKLDDLRREFCRPLRGLKFIPSFFTQR
jgi:hypothetical protein